MSSQRDPAPYLKDVVDPSGRYARDAFRVVLEGVLYALSEQETPRHLTAAEVQEGVCARASNQYGLMAVEVLAGWGLRSSTDVGAVVHLLADQEILTLQEDDRPEDFEGLPDLGGDLRSRYQIRYTEADPPE